MVARAIAAANTLEQKGISVRLINLHTIKPLDEKTILTAAQETRAIITVEEHQVAGGMGSAVAEILMQSSHSGIPFKIMGVHDSFGESGSAESLLEKYGLTSQDISSEAIKLLPKKRK